MSGEICKLADHLLNIQYKKGPNIGFVPRSVGIINRQAPYPEITGYAVTSLMRAFHITKEEKYRRGATLAAKALIDTQWDSGLFPSVWADGKAHKVTHVFDNIIIARGLLDYSKGDVNNEYRIASFKCLDALNQFYVTNGGSAKLTHDGNRVASEFPDYFWINLKMLIPLIIGYELSSDTKWVKFAECVFNLHMSRFESNGTFIDPTRPVLNRTHYTAYALYGLAAYELLINNEELLCKISIGVETLIEHSLNSEYIPVKYLIKINSRYDRLLDVPVTAQILELLSYLSRRKPCAKARYDRIRNRLEGALKRQLFHGRAWGLMNGGLPFVKGQYRLPRAIPWGTEFYINYLYDKESE